MSNEQTTNVRSLLFSIAKWCFVLLIALFIFNMTASNRVSNADFAAVSDAVLQSADLTPMVPGDNQMIKRIYGLDPENYDGMLLYYPSSNMGAEELLLVKLSDLSQQETVRNVLENRRISQRDAFAGYGPEQYEMLDNGIVEVRGNYLLLIVAADPEPVRKSFLGAL